MGVPTSECPQQARACRTGRAPRQMWAVPAHIHIWFYQPQRTKPEGGCHRLLPRYTKHKHSSCYILATITHRSRKRQLRHKKSKSCAQTQSTTWLGRK